MIDLNEQSKSIGRKIHLYTQKEVRNIHLHEDDNPISWYKQEFIASLLFHASEQKYYAPGREAVEEVMTAFVKASNLDVNLDKLFEKYWLREVMSIVHMPAVIRRGIHLVKRIKNCKQEIEFLRTIRQDRERKFSVSEFEALIKNYEEETSIRLNITGAKEAHLVSIENDTVTINNVAYYDIVVKNWNEFMFLDFLYDNIYGEQRHLFISKDKLATLHVEHTANYARTPTISQIISAGIVKEVSEGFIISIFETSHGDERVLDEAGANLWNKLNNAEPRASKEAILNTWCRKIVLRAEYRIDIHKHLKGGQSDEFNQAAVTIINKEKDLGSGTEEYKKALLDYYMSRDLPSVEFVANIEDSVFSKETTDVYDTLRIISEAQKWTTDDYLYFHQSCRETIFYLTGQVIKSYTCESRTTERINELTKDTHRKPFLVWTLCFWIWQWRPELIPALMRNTGMASALFSIVKKIEVTKDLFESPFESKFKITTALFKHLLNVLQLDASASNKQKAKTVFDCFLTALTPQFQIKGQSPSLQAEIKNNATKIADEIKIEFSTQLKQYGYYSTIAHPDDLYYPTLLKDLLEYAIHHSGEHYFNNSVIDFDYVKFDLLTYLLRLSQELPSQNSEARLSHFDIAQELLKCYTTILSAITVASRDYNTGIIKNSNPIFLPASQNIEAIEWNVIYLLLEEENLSSSFLHPVNLNFNSTGDKYDDFNRFIIDKLRIHLKVLITTYKAIQRKATHLKKLGIAIDSSLNRLQNAILDIVLPYSLDDPSKQRIDIFNEHYERPTFGGRGDELIPQLGEIANYFPSSEREKLIKAVLRSEPLIRALKLMEVMSSEHDQALLLTVFNREDFQTEMKSISTLNDYQFLLGILSKHTQFQNKAKEVLAYWEKEVAPRWTGYLSNEVIVTTYRTKLLLAFQANDLQQIEAVAEPQEVIYFGNTQKLFPQNEKNFYRALYYFKNGDPGKAYQLFNDLVNRKDDDTIVVALNRFAAKINWAEKETDPTQKYILFSEAFDQWEKYQKSLPANISLDSINDNLLHNKLVSLDALERHEEFDALYNGLSYIDRVKPGFFEIGFQNKLSRKMKDEALNLIDEASIFHKTKEGIIPDFIVAMKTLISANEDPEVLKNAFRSALSAKPELLVQIVPDSVNKGKSVNEYLLYYIVGTANDMLSNINSIQQIANEDKYSDLMIMGLNGRMSFHHWHATPSRGGFSGSKLNNPGEIDFMISEGNNNQLAICEALILKGENNFEVQKHSVKIFNYTPSKQELYLIIYYLGPETKFLSSWEKYKNSIQSIVEYPASYSIIGDLVDLSNKYNNAAIRVGMTLHGSGIKLHHVFVNINYKAVH